MNAFHSITWKLILAQLLTVLLSISLLGLYLHSTPPLLLVISAVLPFLIILFEQAFRQG